jgi:hypothetical protein|tara:strand:- start:845 stop:1507 length:663 start_codon:yes stop_codon:yes gene_type:complete
MTTKEKRRIWFCGVPGSKWSGIDINLRQVLPCDRTDETSDRIFYHRASTPEDTNNGHRGSYWGPGQGCGEDWLDFNHITPNKLIDDINTVFTGDGYQIIKSHFLARHFNLDYIWNNFPNDYIVLIYREPQKSFAWWSEVMDFTEGHYPDYRPGYKDYNTMRSLIWNESSKITDFAIKKGMKFQKYNTNDVFAMIDGYKYDIGNNLTPHQTDVYVAITQII